MDIVIVGSLAYDDLETEAGIATNSLGGSGTFAGIAAAFHSSRRMDTGGTLPVGLVCAVGDDFGESEFELLKQAGLDLTRPVGSQGHLSLCHPPTAPYLLQGPPIVPR